MKKVLWFVLASVLVAGFAAAPGYAQAPGLLCAFPEPAVPASMLPPPTVREEPLYCPPPPRATRPLRPEDATRAWARAAELRAEGRFDHALIELATVRRVFPALDDRLAMLEAELHEARGDLGAACDAYARGAEGPHRSFAARARIEEARCRLSAGDRAGVELFATLSRRYAELAQANQLSLLLARAHEGWGEPEEAARLYRELDLLQPGAPQAREAREAMARLATEGVEIRPLSTLQRVERAERLVRSGPPALAREVVAELREETLPRPLAAQLAQSAARLARVEGRFDDAQALLREARGQPALDEEEREALERQARDLNTVAESRAEEEARRRVRGLTRGRPLTTQPTARIFGALRIAARAGVTDIVDEALRALARNDRLPPGLRFEAAILATGVGDDARIAALLEGAERYPSHAVAARYHRARALERLGEREEADRLYRAVIAGDDTRLPYYAIWARDRLSRVTHEVTHEATEANAVADEDGGVAAMAPLCDRGPFCAPPALDMIAQAERRTWPNDVEVTPIALPADALADVAMPTLRTSPRPQSEASDEAANADDSALDLPDLPLDPQPSLPELAEGETLQLLRAVAENHGEAYPWLGRAVALLELGETAAATDELHELFTAYRDATGGGSLRADVEGVLRGAAPPRHRATGATWRARRGLGSADRNRLARASAALGDYGLAIRFGGFSITGPRPRAHEAIVEAAAARHGVDPDLLFAVMRVESVYNPRIISYAGAVGLMQIMPRTGRLIAHAQGRDDFTVDQLLEPEVNIDMAAWYLRSLLERFDGRIPLAIASYNGGPHNVRRWIEEHGSAISVDALAERIPFSQTHRYVRRVLTHYAAYRAQRGLALPGLEVDLPELGPDRVAF